MGKREKIYIKYNAGKVMMNIFNTEILERILYLSLNINNFYL